MERHFVWVTTRRVEPGTLEDFERAWRPGFAPDGMLRALAYWSEDGQEITGVSIWASREACDAWRSSDAERERREAMAPYVVQESEGFYRGGELTLPSR
ncbi:antibiotic biosynthesis monooxygenase [Streptomyces sp. NPDC003035]|uniref:antibiotic biosynthesis monooxygenase n=1 Tax=unclassified Streptomyces TaxID=2593676 RepID=UPI0033AC87F7